MEPENNNITFRRAHTQLVIRNNESDLSIDALDGTTSSLPDISVDNDQITNLTTKIEDLQIQLNSAHGEIEQLLLENKDLKKQNQELSKKNELYNKIRNSPSKFGSPTSTVLKNTKPQSKPKVHKQTQTQSIQKMEAESEKIRKLHKETQTIQITTDSVKKIHNLTNKQTQTCMSSEHKQHETTYNIQNLSKKTRNSTVNYKLALHPPKLCLISSNKQNKVLSIAQDTMQTNFNVCHFLTPNGSTRHILKGIQTKLANFTMDDYCVLFIGDQDFLETNNNIELIDHLREVLQKITHTNIVVCTPTYQYGFNREYINQRIQNFNNLLYQDINTYNYAYLIDTNKHLIYDYSMFHKASGTISNTGLRTIFQDLTHYIEKIKKFVSYRDSHKIELSKSEHEQIKTQLFRE